MSETVGQTIVKATAEIVASKGAAVKAASIPEFTKLVANALWDVVHGASSDNDSSAIAEL